MQLLSLRLTVAQTYDGWQEINLGLVVIGNPQNSEITCQ